MTSPSARFTESEVEDAALEWLEGLGWNVAHGPEIAPHAAGAERTDYTGVILERQLLDALDRLNPDLPAEALEDALRKLTRPKGSTLEAKNRAFHRMLADGVTVEYRTASGSMRGAQVSVLDYEDAANNDWLAVNQFTVVEGERERRPDIVLFVNGLPLGLIELKNPAEEKATVWTAWKQIQTYKNELPHLFSFNAALIASDGVDARIGSACSGYADLFVGNLRHRGFQRALDAAAVPLHLPADEVGAVVFEAHGDPLRDRRHGIGRR